jgi:hypothetical protein
VLQRSLEFAEHAGGEVLKRLVFEVADRELDDGVLAMLGFHDLDLLGAVGEKREVAPVGPQLGLRANQAGAPHDHPLASERHLGDLGLAVLGVVIERPPVRLGDRVDRVPDALLHADAD